MMVSYTLVKFDAVANSEADAWLGEGDVLSVLRLHGVVKQGWQAVGSGDSLLSHL